MKPKVICFALAVLILLTFVIPNLARDTTIAQTGGDYDLSWNTIDGGGFTFSSGGEYTLGGTIAQPDAGLMTGGDYTILGGFWIRGLVNYKITFPLIVKSD